MNQQMLCKVKYTKQLENGTFKRVSEPYLLDAITFTDAEARIYEELGSIIRGEFVVQAIAREDLQEIFLYDDSDTFYKCKTIHESMDSDEEKSKKITQTFLVMARSTKEANERLLKNLADMMVEFKVVSVIETPIVEYFPYSENLDKEISRKPLVEGVSPEQL